MNLQNVSWSSSRSQAGGNVDPPNGAGASIVFTICIAINQYISKIVRISLDILEAETCKNIG